MGMVCDRLKTLVGVQHPGDWTEASSAMQLSLLVVYFVLDPVEYSQSEARSI